jgi:exodeoxyribonuclease V gamma subunit
VIKRTWPLVEAIVACARGYADEQPRSVGINARLGDGTILTGSVSGVRGNVLLGASYSRLNPRHRIAAWVRLLALTAADPSQPFEAVTVGKAPYDSRADLAVARIAPLGPDAATREERALGALGRLVELRDRGLRDVLPVPPATAAAYARASAEGADAEAAAGKAWTSGFRFEGEDVDPDHVRAFGGVLTLAELFGRRPLPDERGEGWDETEPTRVGRSARRLWDELLAAENVSEL